MGIIDQTCMDLINRTMRVTVKFLDDEDSEEVVLSPEEGRFMCEGFIDIGRRHRNIQENPLHYFFQIIFGLLF